MRFVSGREQDDDVPEGCTWLGTGKIPTHLECLFGTSAYRPDFAHRNSCRMDGLSTSILEPDLLRE